MSSDGENVLQGPWVEPIESDIYAAKHEPDPGPKDEPPKQTVAGSILAEAFELIEGDRNDQHGPREKCHAEIAKLWTWWMGIQVDAHDVAILMTLLKIARIKTGSYNKDCYTDGCGYLSIAGELRNGRGL